MNHYITGTTIKSLRKKRHMIQAELAAKLCASDKTISKWETGVSQRERSRINPTLTFAQPIITRKGGMRPAEG